MKQSRFWNWIDKWFISSKIRSSGYNLDKGRILALVHLFLMLIVLLTFLLSWVATPENAMDLATSLALVVSLPVIFKVFGNLNFSGNLLAVGFCAVLVPMIYETGGLFSDNVLWMLMCPIVVMLFSSKNAVLVWLAGLLGFIYFLFLEHKKLVNAATSLAEQHEPVYYFISISMLFCVVVLVVYIFKTGEERIIRDLQKNQANLETRQRELTAANLQLRQMGEQLQSSNRDLESFAYAASHDLKEPLRMIGSYTSLLHRRLKDTLSEDNLEMMGFVQQGVKQMQRLLEDVLEYSRVGRGMDKMKQVDLDDVMFYIRNSLRLQLQETGAEILIEKELPAVHARYSEMVQLFQNLIANAVKFRKKDVLPVVRISWVEREGYFHFFLADNGIGIEANFQEKVFNLFERLNSRQDYDGSGIGLATCKKIVENFGGSIGLESTHGEGTTFHFSLPKSVEAMEKALETVEQLEHRLD